MEERAKTLVNLYLNSSSSFSDFLHQHNKGSSSDGGDVNATLFNLFLIVFVGFERNTTTTSLNYILEQNRETCEVKPKLLSRLYGACTEQEVETKQVLVSKCSVFALV